MHDPRSACRTWTVSYKVYIYNDSSRTVLCVLGDVGNVECS